MPRRKTGRKRGRPADPHARRRHTTRAGRKGLLGAPPRDQGTIELRVRKRVVGAGREDVEMTPIGALFARQVLDRTQYDLLSMIAATLAMARAAGPKGLSVGALWNTLLLRGARGGFNPAAGDAAFGLAAHNQNRLAWIVNRLNGTRELVIALAEGRIPELVVRVFRNEATAEDRAMLERLRVALDGISVGPGYSG